MLKILEQYKFSNINYFTPLNELCHFSKTRTIKITGFKLEHLVFDGSLLYAHDPEKELLFPISSPFKRYLFEILPAFPHVLKALDFFHSNFDDVLLR